MIALLTCLFVWPALGLGQTRTGVFRVSNIPVDVTSSDAVSARRDALAQGQREGLERLMRRLVPADRYGQLPAAADLPMERYVQSFEIANEEVSNTRYLAELTVGYDAEAVRELLAKQGLPFAEMRSAPLLVLPLYEAPGGPVLWPENNPWWQAWADNLDPERLLRLVLPLGDLGDMALVNVGQVQAGDEAALLALAERYDTKDVLVVTATPVQGTAPNAAPSVRLQTRRVGGVMQVNPPEVVTGQPGQIEEELLAEAVRRLQNSLDEQWKAANLLRYDQAGSMV
ncbi:MAG: DUF2066 domain-containing protein, partial [Geminicoccaceae bacterium]